MDVEKLAEPATAVSAEVTYDFQGLPIDDLYLLVDSVRYVNELLLFVRRERDVKGGAFLRKSLTLDVSLFYIGSVDLENLNPVVPPVS